MAAYVSRRLLQLIPVLLGVTVVVFVLIHLIPGDPTISLLGENATIAQRVALRHTLGLDQPLPVQYFKWLWQTLHLNLGMSISQQQPVIDLVWAAFVNTLILAGCAGLIAAVAGTLLGVVAAVRQGGIADRIAMALAALGTAIPGYWLGLILIVAFAIDTHLLPSSGETTPIGGGGVSDVLAHLILPAIAASAAPTGIVARTVRASLLDIMRLNFVVGLRSLGLKEHAIVRKHVARNALPGIVTVFGLQAGYLLGGVAFVEVVFAWPGVGNLLFLSIGDRDYPVVLGITLFVSVAFVFINLAVDLLHAALDPRVRAAVTAGRTKG